MTVTGELDLRRATPTLVRYGLMLLVAFFAGCATVPHDIPKTTSVFMTDTSDTHFGRLALNWADTHGELSGFFPLGQGMDALGARLRMLEKAEKSVDLQYFLMKDDTAGQVMLHALLQAADRGVRIRFLLDDIFTSAPDRNLLLINQHPNVEVRLFNPISRRGMHWLNFLGDFRRANRRMHNKSFTVDNAISIVGGRNIADEYFQLKKTAVFADFDVLAFGPIASDILTSFDAYWNHTLAIPIEQLSSEVEADALEAVRALVDTEVGATYSEVYEEALQSQLLQELITGRQSFFEATARVLADDPEKLENKVGVEHQKLVGELVTFMSNAEREVIFISPYFVPGKNGVELIRALVEKDIRVIVATNSLASNNHTPVHSGYTRYRKDTIRAGAELYEARADAGRISQAGGDGVGKYTLHTKLILVDRRYLFVGSLNLDPRSIDINAEMGLLIDSEEMTGALADVLDEVISVLAYRVDLNAKGKLEWTGLIDGAAVVETSEPQAGRWLRFKAWILKIGPESQL
jgi:putative cardiolipin synthase